jgi:hypothetical protein
MTEATTLPVDERDDFSAKTVDLIAKRSGYICAYPGCGRMTIAGSDDRKSGLTVTGVAAHITAASRRGPRYDSLMSSEERSSETNGIWACQIHGKFIDDNPSKCTIEELQRWKLQHERWVFERVEGGVDAFNSGLTNISFKNIGALEGEYFLQLGRSNIIIGANEAGKTTLCEIIAAFSGGHNFKCFNHRFSFDQKRGNQSYILAKHKSKERDLIVRLSPQSVRRALSRFPSAQRVEIELNSNPSPDWPRRPFNCIHFKDQLRKTKATDPSDGFIKAIRYLAIVFNTTEELIWAALRDEFFASSLFGYRFNRTGKRAVDVLVPDGRTFYLPHRNLSSSEQQIAFLDITLRLIGCNSINEGWLLIFDNDFFSGLDTVNKVKLLSKLTSSKDLALQTIFALNPAKDADHLVSLQTDKWIHATKVQNLTIHSFM